MRFFGYKIERSSEQEDKKNRSSIQIIEKDTQDGSLELSAGSSGFLSYGVAFDNAPVADEGALITRYRELSLQPEVEKAIDDIINEAFNYDDEQGPLDIDLSKLTLPDKTKKKIKEEFDNILRMLNFKNDCYQVFQRWYVDGRIYYQKIINEKNPKKGIVELRYIDPRKIKKIREQLPQNKRAPEFAVISMNNLEPNKKYIEYYVYNPKGVNSKRPEGVPISPDSITYVHSGILDKTNQTVLSHLHKAIKPFNSLRMMEDALVIYRITRAPERRVFNIEVGNLPKLKAEQYVSEIMRKFNKKLKYDSETGEVSDDKRIMTMLEDFWFPKRNGQGTTVDPLPGGQTLGEIEDVDYFKKKLYEALNVPVSRLEQGTGFNIGRPSEITRDELKFTKFVVRLRARFAALFLDILEDQLLLKGILNSTEWEEIKDDIALEFNEDNMFTEMKWSEIWQQRIQNLQSLGYNPIDFFSKEWARINMLHLTEDEWKEMQKQIEKERKEDPSLDPNNMGMGADSMGGGFDQQPPGGDMDSTPQDDADGSGQGEADELNPDMAPKNLKGYKNLRMINK